MKKIREYRKGLPVEIYWKTENNRCVVKARLDNGCCNFVEIDLLDLLEWIREFKPELFSVGLWKTLEGANGKS